MPLGNISGLTRQLLHVGKQNTKINNLQDQGGDLILPRQSLNSVGVCGSVKNINECFGVVQGEKLILRCQELKLTSWKTA